MDFLMTVMHAIQDYFSWWYQTGMSRTGNTGAWFMATYVTAVAFIVSVYLIAKIVIEWRDGLNPIETIQLWIEDLRGF